VDDGASPRGLIHQSTCRWDLSRRASGCEIGPGSLADTAGAKRAAALRPATRLPRSECRPVEASELCSDAGSPGPVYVRRSGMLAICFSVEAVEPSSPLLLLECAVATAPQRGASLTADTTPILAHGPLPHFADVRTASKGPAIPIHVQLRSSR
jgi:hypothetical protein